MTRRSILVVSTPGPQGMGGLSVYARELVHGIRDAYSTAWARRFDGDGPPHLDYAAAERERHWEEGGVRNAIVAPRPRSLIRPVPWLVHRNGTRGLAIRTYEQAFRAALER